MDLKKRLNAVIRKDKANNPKYIINVIKSDFYYLISSYFEVDFEDIDINIDLEKDKYKINVKCFGDRLKSMRVLPE